MKEDKSTTAKNGEMSLHETMWRFSVFSEHRDQF